MTEKIYYGVLVNNKLTVYTYRGATRLKNIKSHDFVGVLAFTRYKAIKKLKYILAI